MSEMFLLPCNLGNSPVPKICAVCNYSTTKESNWNKHIQTTKHKLQGKPRTYNCSTCDKQYNVYKSLWSHEKVCGLAITSQLLMTENQSLHTIIQSHSTTISAITTQNESIANYMKDASDTMTSYMKDTSEMMRNVLDITKSISTQPVQQITNHIVQQNTQNNSFNIQVFLDEKCGDAMNLSAFLKTLAITNEDLVRNTEIGFVAGMSAIIKREMCDKLPVNKRPVHCTDIKRETVYYRENDKWHKEEGKVVEEDMMYQLTRDCLRTYAEWRRVHPDTKDIHSKFNLLCDRIPSAVVGGLDRATVYPKTMREIYKHCLIDKKNMR